MIKQYGNIFLDGNSIIQQEFQNILHKRNILESNSKHHTGDRVRVTEDISKIVDILYPTYTKHEALQIARGLAGSIVEIFSVENLTDDNDTPGIYYSIEDDLGMYYVLPENMLFSVNQ